MTPREWVTYEVQCYQARKWVALFTHKSKREAMREIRFQRDVFSKATFRAVAITHTERVIG